MSTPARTSVSAPYRHTDIPVRNQLQFENANNLIRRPYRLVRILTRFYDIVNLPPFVEEVQIYQKGERKYRKWWEEQKNEDRVVSRQAKTEGDGVLTVAAFAHQLVIAVEPEDFHEHFPDCGLIFDEVAAGIFSLAPAPTFQTLAPTLNVEAA